MDSDSVQSRTQPGDGFAVRVERMASGVVALTVSGELDIVTAPRLSETLSEVIRERPARVLVDLTQVDFMSSAAMTVLVSAQQEAGSDVAIRVVASGNATFRPMHLTGVDENIAVYATRDEALAAE